MKQPMSLDEVFRRAGGHQQLAKAIGLHRTSPLSWTRVPAERVMAVAKALKVKPQQLRPDMFV